MKKALSVVGFYGAGNLGDDLLLEALLKLLLENKAPQKLKFEELKIFSQSKHKPHKLSSKKLKISLVSKFNPWELLKALSQSKYLLFGGGSIFQDQSSLRSLFYYLGLILLAKILKNRILLVSQGLGPLNSKLSRFFLEKSFKLVDYASFRDLLSYRITRRFFPTKRLFYSQDLVWALDFPVSLVKKAESSLKTKIILSLRPSKFLGDSFLFALRDFLGSKFLSEKKAKDLLCLELICLSKEDLSISKKFRELLIGAGFSEQSFKIFELFRAEDLESFIQSLSSEEEIFAFPTRFHALILLSSLAKSFSLKIKTWAIVYDPKVKSLAKLLRVSYFDPSNLKEGKLVSTEANFLDNNKEELKEHRGLIQADFERIIKLYG